MSTARPRPTASTRGARRIGLLVVAALLAAFSGAALFAAPAQAAGGSNVQSIDCSRTYHFFGDGDQYFTTWVLPGQDAVWNQENCSSVDAQSGTITPSVPDGSTPPAQLTASAGAALTLHGPSGQAINLSVVQVAALPNPASGQLLSTQTVTLPQNGVSEGTVPGALNQQHQLGGQSSCLIQNGPHIYKTLDLDITTAGNYTFRVVTSQPNDYVNIGDYTPMSDPFLAVYSSFSPTAWDSNVVGCNDDFDNDNGAGLQGENAYSLADGTIDDGHNPSFDANLAVGHYTLVLMTWSYISAADYSAGQFPSTPGSFSPGDESATYQLWGPTGGLTVLLPPVITSAAPAATLAQGAPFTTTVTASGRGVTFALASGALPPGLTLDPTTGVISGVPTTAGIFSYTISASNAEGSVSAAYTQQVQQSTVTGASVNTGGALVSEPADSSRIAVLLLALGVAALIIGVRLRPARRRG